MNGMAGVRRASLVIWLLIYGWTSASTGTGVSTTKAPGNGSNGTDGLGLAYAESCQAQLFGYNNASLAYYSTAPYATETFANTLTIVSISEASAIATSLTTLCDGHPRVVGDVEHGQSSTSVYTSAYTNTNRVRQTTGFTQTPPCTIGPKDCESLQTSWTSHWNSLSAAGNLPKDGLEAPPCTTSSPTHSYSTNSAGRNCDNCLIVASSARLLYWPVSTAPGSGDLCNKSASILSGTPTGNGPNTFVTSGLTITSPTVAVSIAMLSRADGCGTTIQNTIIPVNPEEVSSVRGNRALFSHYPFNYADLNWHCANGEYVSEGNRTTCYQEVPADAYFDGTQHWAGLDALDVDWRTDKNLTISNDYQPQILPPETMTKAIASIWGSSCLIHPDGVWDPPKALQTADTEIGVAWGPAKATMTASLAQSSEGPASRSSLSNLVTATALAESTEAGPSWPASSAHSTAAPQTQTTGSSEATDSHETAGNSDQQSAGGQFQSESGTSGSQQSAGEQVQPSTGGQNAGEASGSTPKVVVIQSVTFTHTVQTGGVDVLTNSDTCITLSAPSPTGTSGDTAGSIAAGLGMSKVSSAALTGGSEPVTNSPSVVVVSEHTYTVIHTTNGGYQIVGDGTSVDIQAATSMQSTYANSSTGSSQFLTTSGSSPTSTSGSVSTPTTSSTATSERFSVVAISIALIMQALCLVSAWG